MELTTELYPTLSGDNETVNGPHIKPLVSFAVLDMFSLVNDFALCAFISLFGVFTNTANIIVYSKMGFSESSNINFFALSLVDLCLSLVTFLLKLFYSPVLRELSSGVTTTMVAISLSPAMMVSVCGSAMMTALISTERCLCVVFPLKIKTFLTRRRVVYLVLAIMVYLTAFLSLLYADTGPPYDSKAKKQGFYYFCFFAIPSTTCFFIVVITTIFLVIRLRRSLQFRRDTASQSEKSSDKENRIVRTIIAISMIFIICFFPNVANFFAQIIYPPFRFDDPYLGNLTIIMFTFSGVFQAISSSINIFFYYKMSSKFKRTFSKIIICSQGIQGQTESTADK
ncbi:hypothetical protein EGW08_021363 [Elysia chlorotica]|uniref:G-protein coupled receptors family 1 profile domain-containing protein n=1 Tax=Elysia chlorotica TaxID=188477 RepID=A0A433SNR7_ELYCH|nr:hypothetical protein EGW08_021363 [Elysia chlorotica]